MASFRVRAVQRGGGLQQAKAASAVALLLVLLLPALAGADEAPAEVGGQRATAGFQLLKSAIQQANANARVCKMRPGCVGTTVKLVLDRDVQLSAKLPALNYSASLAVSGRCNDDGQPRRCVIDGAGKHQIFTGPGWEPVPTGSLTLRGLVIQNAKGGVLYKLIASVSASFVTFRNNDGGVDISMGLPGGYPLRSFTRCIFTDNVGGVILAGNPKYGLSSAPAAYRVRACVFKRNRGASAITLMGFGTSFFLGSHFAYNTAPSSGAAISLEATTAIFRNVSFVRNTALQGCGGAVAGESSYFGPVRASFCDCGFSDNRAPKAKKGRSVCFSPAEVTKGGPVPEYTFPGSTAFCATGVAVDDVGEVFVPRRSTWNYTTQASGPCSAKICPA